MCRFCVVRAAHSPRMTALADRLVLADGDGAVGGGMSAPTGVELAQLGSGVKPPVSEWWLPSPTRVARSRGHSMLPSEASANSLVYHWCMSRTNIDIDDELCRKVMDRFHLSTKREAVNLALQHLAGEPLTVAEARSLRGSGWDGDLDEMRSSRA